MMARSDGPTVKKPEAMNTTTSRTITTLTTAKLLRNASASACEPASIGLWPGPESTKSLEGGLFMPDLFIHQIGGNAIEQIERRRMSIKDEYRTLLERTLKGIKPENEV